MGDSDFAANTEAPQPRTRLRGGLLRRFIWGTLAGLVVSSLVFLILYVSLYRSELAQERALVTESVSSLLLAALENSMLKADVAGLHDLVAHLGGQPGVSDVLITNPVGEIRFASSIDQVGTTLPTAFQIPDRPTTELVQLASGDQVIRSRLPIINRESCSGCHGPVAAKPVNGLLIVDYDAAPIQKKVRTTTLLLMSAGALIVLLNLAGGWWFMRRFVLRPVSHLTAFSDQLRNGDLHARVAIRSSDEFEQLAETVNTMAGEIELRVQQIAAQRQFLQDILDAIPDGLRVIDSDYRQVLVNQAYLNQVGSTAAEALGQPCYASSHGRSEPCPATLNLCPLAELSPDSDAIKALQMICHQGGSSGMHAVEVYAAPLTYGPNGARMIVESIRDLQSQARYSHEQRLAELGKLAAAVAHEVHNPLSSLRMLLYGLRAAVSRGSVGIEEVKKLDVIEHEIEKCSQVTQKLLKLSNLPDDKREPVDFAAAIGETLSLVGLEAEQNKVSIHAELPTESVWILASDSALRMITLNLAQNAIHALSSTGGQLRVTMQTVAGRVEAEFADDGPGIPADILAHIFEPFFSRRADGQTGTGLGLSICRSLAEKYDGQIKVQSQLGQGTRFSVSFPDPATILTASGNP